MARIDWDHTFSIDIEEIDLQHQVWINIINDLNDALYNSSSESLVDETKKAIKSMWEYTRFHFKTEEAYMGSINYPDFPSHQVIHDKFSLEVLQIYNDIKDDKQVLSTTVMDMLITWLQEHILQEDKKIGLYLSR